MTPPVSGHLHHQMRYALPLWLVMKVCSLLPENRYSCQLRGRLASPFIGHVAGRLELGSGVVILHSDRLVLGRDVYIAHGSWLNAMGGLRIEDEVMLGPYSVITTARHEFKDGSARRGGSNVEPVRIGRGSWLASHVTVSPGASVGPGCRVGANSVVVSDLPDGQFAAGVPAQVKGPVQEVPAATWGRNDL